jgi:outer membrane protein OmpA-like peptidoglycan-associated protein
MVEESFYRRPTRPFTLNKRWLFTGLLFSAVLHFLLVLLLQNLKLEKFGEEYYDTLVPAKFNVKRVDIDPRLLDPPVVEASEPDEKPRPIESIALPEMETTKAELDEEILATPTAPVESLQLEHQMSETENLLSRLETPKAARDQMLSESLQETDSILLDKAPAANTTRTLPDASDPTVRAADLPALPAGSALEINKERPGFAPGVPAEDPLKELLTESAPGGSKTSMVDLAREAAKSDSKDEQGSGSVPQGYTTLDDLLAGSGPVTGSRGPILMPTDLLFEYDSADLRPGAVSSLEKLGTLIQRSPHATFRIEGHTDSFGSEEYNQTLSERRAESVKNWLMQVMKIPGDRIETRGFGKSRLLVPATGTVEEQMLNRRVEIVIRTR